MRMKGAIAQWMQRVLGAIAFYTTIPIPAFLPLDFQYAARFAPGVGLLIGLILAGGDVGLSWLGCPPFTRSALVIAAWVVLTGGLHLDGAMDTADGLAVMDPERRLEVMADSRVGAFGAIAALLLLLLKTSALTDLESSRGFAITLAAGWGRWGQQVAIARYPYLKPIGKGAFHKAALPSLGFCLPSLVLVLVVHGVWWAGFAASSLDVLLAALAGLAIALGSGYWFYTRFRGQTGDTYGAIVEWTEALFLVVLTILL